MAVMAARGQLSIHGDLKSDTAPIACLVERLREAGVAVHALRDPTRGGVAESLNEMAEAAGATVVIEEEKVPVRPAVRTACELLGIDRQLASTLCTWPTKAS